MSPPSAPDFDRDSASVRSSSRTASRPPRPRSKVYDTLDFTRALNVYNNSFRGASALGLVKGFRSSQAPQDNTHVLVFSELLDSAGLFITGNADGLLPRPRST